MTLVNLITIVSILGIFLIPKEKSTTIREYGLISSGIILLISIFIYGLNTGYEEPVLSTSTGLIADLISNGVQMDSISGPFVLLTAFIIPFCLLVSQSITFRMREFVALLLISELILFNGFSTTNLLFFYVTFESILIPFFLIIGVWGSREKERTTAAYQLVLFTLVGSFLFLIALTLIYMEIGSFDFHNIMEANLPSSLEYFIFISFFIALAVKIPMFPAYIWLPKAHVEAPTAGSVLLAGILLKLGSYGIIRFLYLFPKGCTMFTPAVIVLSLIGIVISLMAALRQTDLKRIIAYSSISHLNYLNLGLFSATSIGLLGGYSLMLFHGLVSSALFLGVGILYDRYKTRNIWYLRQGALTKPLFATILFILMMANIGFPGTSNFISEIMIFISTFQTNIAAAAVATISLFITAIAGFWVITRILFGNYSFQSQYLSMYKNYIIKRIADLNGREMAILLPFLILILILGFKPNLILHPCEFIINQLTWDHWSTNITGTLFNMTEGDYRYMSAGIDAYIEGQW